MKYCQYAILAQGDDIPQLLGKKWRDSRFLYAHLKIFKVASILCFMSIQIPIPKVSFYTPPSPFRPPKFLATCTCMTTLLSPPPHCVKSKLYT